MGIFRDDDEEEEEYTGHTKDPIHDAIYGWDMGSGSYSQDYEGGLDVTNSNIELYSKKAWDLYMDYREEEALHYIDMALDLNDCDSKNWNIKAIILEGMKRYRESEECYNKSLALAADNMVYDNRARMLYDWSSQLLEESKNCQTDWVN